MFQPSKVVQVFFSIHSVLLAETSVKPMLQSHKLQVFCRESWSAMQDQRHGIVVASALHILPRNQMDGRILYHQLSPSLA